MDFNFSFQEDDNCLNSFFSDEIEDIIDNCTNGPSNDEDDFDWLKLSSAKVIGVVGEYKEDRLSRTPKGSAGFKHTKSKVINYDEKDFNNNTTDMPLRSSKVEGMSATNSKRNNYGNSDKNNSNNNAIDELDEH